MLLTEVGLPDHHPRAGSPCEVFGFLIDHPSGPIVVDTGVGSGHEGIDSLFHPIHHPIEESLGDHGVALGDVTMVINSHLHFDHCGNNRLFPGVPLVVQRSEYELAQEPGHTISDWVDFEGAEWLLVDGRADVMPGITVVPTPGHTPGHQSVVVTRTGGVDIIAGQCVYDPGELDAERSIEPLDAAEAHQTSASARLLKSLNPAAVFFSHDAGVWRSPS